MQVLILLLSLVSGFFWLGDTLVLTVIRTIGNFGNVSVFWDMSSEFGNVSAQFSPTRGVVNLLPVSWILSLV